MTTESTWETICKISDINTNTGVCALLAGEQVAIFKVGQSADLFAISNFDPFGEANVLSRGLVGDLSGEIVVASPLYKQHFALASGKCLEDETVTVKTYPVREHEGMVQLQA